MDLKEYERRFRKSKTSYLISNYHKFNAEYRRYAREELKKRRVPVSRLPYKPYKKRPRRIGIEGIIGY